MTATNLEINKARIQTHQQLLVALKQMTVKERAKGAASSSQSIDQKGKQAIAKIRFFVYNGCNVRDTRCGLIFFSSDIESTIEKTVSVCESNPGETGTMNTRRSARTARAFFCGLSGRE